MVYEWLAILPANQFPHTKIRHDDVIKWKHFPRYWPFVRGIHRSLVNSPHKGPWRGALMFSLISAWIKGWVNNHEAGELRRHRTHYVLFVCCLFVSLLSHFWLIHLFYLHLLYQPYVGLCQATCVQSHQRQSTSAVAIATCEVQVSAADLSDRSKCSHWSFEAAVLPINPNIYIMTSL